MTIIWDWNGTLLNDVKYCVEIMNFLLKKYKLKTITEDYYRKIFRFPVKEYYKTLGFDFEKIPFEQVGKEFIDLYDKNIKKLSLRPNSKEVLNYFKEKSHTQILISARKKQSLIKDLEFFGIKNYFSSIFGIEDDYAHGKEDLFNLFFKNNKTADYLIGDTIYDCQLAKKFNLTSIAITGGHNNAEKLETNCDFIISDLSQLKKII